MFATNARLQSISGVIIALVFSALSAPPCAVFSFTMGLVSCFCSGNNFFSKFYVCVWYTVKAFTRQRSDEVQCGTISFFLLNDETDITKMMKLTSLKFAINVGVLWLTLIDCNDVIEATYVGVTADNIFDSEDSTGKCT